MIALSHKEADRIPLDIGAINNTTKHVSIETLKPGGGFVFAQVHNIQPEVPVKNIIAMYEAYREYASY